MIKIFNNFDNLHRKLLNFKGENRIADFRISLKANNEIDLIIIADENFNEEDLDLNEHVSVSIINKSELEEDGYLENLFKNNSTYNISNSRRRFSNLLNFEDEDKYSPPCPVVTFYSYKGGMGRSTTIATCASYLAVHEQKKIVIIDCDFEAPGFTNFFLEKPAFPKHSSGFVEYVFDKEFSENIEITKYMWEVSEKFKGKGDIYVMPAGNLEDGNEFENEIFPNHKEHYLEGLARLDFASREYIVKQFKSLIDDIKNKINPDVIFIDSRTGFTDIFGLTAIKLSSFIVGFFGNSIQNEPGLHLFIDIINKSKKVFTGILVNSFSRLNQFNNFKNNVEDYLNKIENEKSELGKLNINSYFFGNNDTLSRIGTPDEDPQEFINLIKDKSLEGGYKDLFKKINDLVNDVNKTNKNSRDNSRLKIVGKIELPEKQVDKRKLKKDILTNLLNEWPNLYADTINKEKEIDFEKEYSEKRYFYRHCMLDIFNLDKFLILGNKGTGKSYIYQSLKNKKIVAEIQKRANKTSTDFTFFHVVDKKKLIIETENFANYEIINPNLFYKNFWKVYTWNAIMQISQINNLGYKSAIEFTQIKNDTATIKKYYELINNDDFLIKVENDLEQLDKFLVEQKKYLIVIYDNLDDMVKPIKWHEQIAPLLNFWKYTSFNRIFSKLFVRKDLFNKISGVTNIKDLENNAIEIEWKKEELFAYFFKLVFSKSKVHFFKLMEDYKDFSKKEIDEIKNKCDADNQLPLDEVILRKLSETFFGKYTEDPKFGESYDWLYKNLMNADETISLRPFIDLLQASIENALQMDKFEKPILPHSFYTHSSVRLIAVKRHFEDLSQETGNTDLKKIFEFIDKNQKYKFYEYSSSELDELFNDLKKNYSNLENKNNEDLKKLLIINGVIREFTIQGIKKYSFAFLYKHRLGLRNRTKKGFSNNFILNKK